MVFVCVYVLVLWCLDIEYENGFLKGPDPGMLTVFATRAPLKRPNAVAQWRGIKSESDCAPCVAGARERVRETEQTHTSAVTRTMHDAELNNHDNKHICVCTAMQCTALRTQEGYNGQGGILRVCVYFLIEHGVGGAAGAHTRTIAR